MNDFTRGSFQSAIRSAAKAAARNPAPGDPDLRQRLTTEGMGWLDEQTGRLNDALDNGDSSAVLSRDIYFKARAHLLACRRAA